MQKLSPTQRTVAIGDAAVLVVVTVAGFATHLTLDAFGRMVVTTLASVVAWAAAGPIIGVYRSAVIADPRSVWRVAWAWMLAAPLATFLRAMILDRDIPWAFVLVTLLLNGFALVAWRIAFGWWRARR